MATTIGTRALLSASLAFSVVGCGAATETPVAEDVGQAIQPIINGTASGTAHDAVVVLVSYVGGQPATLCTATLVAPNLVLTARHCVADVVGATGCGQDGSAVTGGAITGDRDPASLVVFTGGADGATPTIDDRSKGAASGTKLVVDDAANVCGHDIAFVVLDRAVNVAPASIRLTPVAAGEGLSAIGYGVDETGELAKTRAVRANLAANVGPGLYPDDPRYGYGPNEVMVGESLCAGDSGGPALSATGAVVGVAARAGNGQPRVNSYADTCVGPHARAVYTSLAGHAELVTRAFDAAGATAKIEGVAVPIAVETAGPAETAPATSSTTTATGVSAPAEASAAGGCSMSSEPQKGSVEYAAGFVALVATLVGLRRRGKREEEDGEDRTRPRLPSLP